MFRIETFSLRRMSSPLNPALSTSSWDLTTIPSLRQLRSIREIHRKRRTNPCQESLWRMSKPSSPM